MSKHISVCIPCSSSNITYICIYNVFEYISTKSAGCRICDVGKRGVGGSDIVGRGVMRVLSTGGGQARRGRSETTQGGVKRAQMGGAPAKESLAGPSCSQRMGPLNRKCVLNKSAQQSKRWLGRWHAAQASTSILLFYSYMTFRVQARKATLENMHNITELYPLLCKVDIVTCGCILIRACRVITELKSLLFFERLYLYLMIISENRNDINILIQQIFVQVSNNRKHLMLNYNIQMEI